MNPEYSSLTSEGILSASVGAGDRDYLLVLKDQLDIALDFNKTSSSFFEKLMLIDIGTIGLSITTITATSAKIQMPIFPKSLFVWLIIVSWLKQLLSTFGCWSLMSASLSSSRKLLRKWTEIGLQMDAKRILLNANIVTSNPNFDVAAARESSERIQAAVSVAEAILHGDEEVTKFQEEIKKVTGQDVVITHSGTFAMLGMRLGLVCLGAAAIVAVRHM